MPTHTEPQQIDDLVTAKRRLILRDTLTFLGLALVTVVLFMVTLFLFRSFAAHRDELAKRWAGRGEAALNAGKPEQAIAALRTALAYAPGERSDELLLARALGDAGHTEESYNYFTGLWDTQPGDGFINLELARLAVKRNNRQSAVHFYRAAIYGTWEGDGVVRRRAVRFELARYLIGRREFGIARTELLIAGGNSPPDAALDVTLGGLLQQADAPTDALAYYQKAISAKPDDLIALQDAGQVAYALGDFLKARRLLERALRAHPAAGESQQRETIVNLLQNCQRILDLEPLQKFSPAERASRILTARLIAKKRFAACSAPFVATGGLPPSLLALNAQWIGPGAEANRARLVADAGLQDATVQLIYDTERTTSQVCGPPTGDDALLLKLAQLPEAATQ